MWSTAPANLRVLHSEPHFTLLLAVTLDGKLLCVIKEFTKVITTRKKNLLGYMSISFFQTIA